MADTKVCSIEGCGKPAKTRGYCNAHYARLLRHGNPLTTKHREGFNYCGKTVCPAAKKINAFVYRIKNADYYKNWRSINAEAIKKVQKEYYNREDVRVAARANMRQWHADNPEHARGYNAKRRARKKQAMPSWLTPDHISQINAVYAEAQRLSIETGTAYHVDHIVPLTGKTVCGLHVPWNLRAIPGDKNLRRPRIYSMDMD